MIFVGHYFNIILISFTHRLVLVVIIAIFDFQTAFDQKILKVHIFDGDHNTRSFEESDD